VERERLLPAINRSAAIPRPFGSVLVQREWDKRLCSIRYSDQTKTVNGFIALEPIPERPWGGFLPPAPVLASGPALGSCCHGAVSSAHAVVHHRAADCLGHRNGGDRSRRCQPAGVRESWPARSSDSVTGHLDAGRPFRSHSFYRGTGTTLPIAQCLVLQLTAHGRTRRSEPIEQRRSRERPAGPTRGVSRLFRSLWTV